MAPTVTTHPISGIGGIGGIGRTALLASDCAISLNS
jgi:hypothetical protein